MSVLLSAARKDQTWVSIRVWITLSESVVFDDIVVCIILSTVVVLEYVDVVVWVVHGLGEGKAGTFKTTGPQLHVTLGGKYGPIRIIGGFLYLRLDLMLFSKRFTRSNP